MSESYNIKKGIISFILIIILNFIIWRVFFAPTNGIFKLFTPMYGLSLITFLMCSIILVTDIFNSFSSSNKSSNGILPFIISLILFFLGYYLFFWNFIGKFGIAYFSPKSIIAAGGVGAEIWNARENSSLAILYFVTSFIFVATLWNIGFKNQPWEMLSNFVIGISKTFAISFFAIIIYSVLYHPHVTSLFVPTQLFAGVIPWWEELAMTSSSFYHLGWMIAGVFFITFLSDSGKDFLKTILPNFERGSVINFIIILFIAVVSGFLFMYIVETILNLAWDEPFTGGNYTDDPRFRHLHVAEIAAFMLFAHNIIKVYFNNFITSRNKFLNLLLRFIAVVVLGMIVYFFYYSNIGAKYIDRVPGVGNVDDTSLCWSIMSITLIMIHEKFFNTFPLKCKNG